MSEPTRKCTKAKRHWNDKQEQVQQMTTYMANFVSHIAKVLPDDIIAKLDELGRTGGRTAVQGRFMRP